MKKDVGSDGDSGFTLVVEYEYSNGWISKKTEHFTTGPSETELNLTFHDNGMVASRGKHLYNENGLLERYQRGGGYLHTATVEYEYDQDGNVVTALIENEPENVGEEKSVTKVVFEYDDDILVSRRTQSAWICYCLPFPTFVTDDPYEDILGIGL